MKNNWAWSAYDTGLKYRSLSQSYSVSTSQYVHVVSRLLLPHHSSTSRDEPFWIPSLYLVWAITSGIKNKIFILITQKWVCQMARSLHQLQVTRHCRCNSRSSHALHYHQTCVLFAHRGVRPLLPGLAITWEPERGTGSQSSKVKGSDD